MSSRPSVRIDEAAPVERAAGQRLRLRHAEQDRRRRRASRRSPAPSGSSVDVAQRAAPPKTSKTAALPSAPMIAPASRPTTSRPAARRVCEAPRSAAPAAVEDQRDLERQPDDVEALQRPGDEEAREVAGEGEPPARAGGEHRRDQQDLLVPVHVAELREDRHDERRQQQLRGLEPVEVGVVDAEVLTRSGISGT